ncbi:MAG: sensor histidine kinase [Gemmatimonadaceae bacterium]
MTDELPRSTQPAPEWATRLLFAFVLLSLAALIVIPWAADQRLQPDRENANRVADEGRRLVTQIHLHMAQEGSAVDDYIDDHAPATMRRFRVADSSKQKAYAQLVPLVASLDSAPKRRMDHLLDLERRWHTAIETELFAEPAPPAPRHGPVQEAIYDSMLVAAAELDDAIAQSARHTRDRIAEREQREQRTSVLLGLLALTAAAATWWLSQRTHTYARAAEERRAALAEVVASRARFMRGVSHDLKNPIHAIDGHAQLLEEGLRGPLTAEQQDSIARIRRSARALMALIEDLLELARAESGQLTVKLDRVVLRDVVREAVEEHRAAAEAAGLTLVHADDKSETILVTDPARVTQVLGNLLSNAIKYTPAGGRIEVMTDMLARRDTDDGARLAIHVADDGPGIPADKYEEVFGEFTRLDSANKPGAGLGLSIARRVARLLGGDITVSGGQGGGARFTLWLPMRKTA